MRITFVHKGRENLGIEYLAAVLKKAGHKINLAFDLGLFSSADNIFYLPPLERIFAQEKRVFAGITESNPDLVAFSIYTDTYPWAVNIAGMVKEKLGIRTVFGGIHATLVPEVVIKNPAVDFVIEGEAEYPMLELVEALARRKSYNNIDNLWYKNRGQINRNKIRPPIEDIDSLPMPDKTLFEKDINYKDDYLALTNRGCVCSCSYCCENYINRIYRNFHRRRSVDSVMKELNLMKQRYRFRAMRFIDSIFFNDKTWLKLLMQRYKEEIKVPFRCFGHIHYFAEEVAGLLKMGGCYAIEFGLQTTNEFIRKRILNCLGTNEQAKRAFGLCDKFRLRYDIDHMFGLPRETESDHLQAATFYNSLGYLNRVKCHNLTYFPKLKIVDTAEKENLLTLSDIKNINQGITGNFLNIDSVKNKTLLKQNKNFKNFFKILPIFSKSTANWILKQKLYKKLSLIPAPIIMFLQFLGAIRKKDYRYLIYLKQYPVWMIQSFFK